MCDNFQAAHRGRRRARLVLLLCASLALQPQRSTQAHNILSEFIQHNLHLTVGTQHLDVTVDLTFFEEWSARERKAMDADGSGDITRAELEAYLNKCAPQLARQVKLRVAGRELPLVPLYNPEVDLLADRKVGPAHHRLRLFYFAPTPELRAGDEIVIEDQLWPEAKAIATPQTEGRDGCKLMNLVSVDAGLTSSRLQDEKRLFRFRCVQPPATKANPVHLLPARQIESAPKPRQPSRTGVAPVSDIGGSGSRASPSSRPTLLESTARNSKMETGATPVLRLGTLSAHDSPLQPAVPMTANFWRQSDHVTTRSTP
jgi:hypothetical protein